MNFILDEHTGRTVFYDNRKDVEVCYSCTKFFNKKNQRFFRVQGAGIVRYVCSEKCLKAAQADLAKVFHYQVYRHKGTNFIRSANGKIRQYDELYWIYTDRKLSEIRDGSGFDVTGSPRLPSDAIKIIDKKHRFLYGKFGKQNHGFENWKHLRGLKK